MSSSEEVLFCLYFIVFKLFYSINSAPNIVFLLADDLGWNDVGFHGSQQVETPEMDLMARDGVILNNYYVMPLCSPSRACLMTARHPVRLGLQHSAIVAGQRLGLPLEYKILPEYLNELGYESHAIGKWHLGFFHKNYTPTYRGFKTFYGYYNGKNNYFDHRNRDVRSTHDWWGLDWHLDIEENLTNVESDFGLYSTRAISTRAQTLISNHGFKEKPLFLYISFQSVHSANLDDPIQAPTATEYKFENVWNVQRRKFIGAVNELDTAIGQIRDSLEKRGVLNNTIIVFSSDNGGPPNGFDMNWANNFPLRAGKVYFYEGGIRGACFVYGDMFNRRAGEVSTEMMHISDWLPTLYDAAGGNVSQLEGIDGFSMLNLLTGKNLTSTRNEVLVNIDPVHNASAIRISNYKYLRNPNNGQSPSYNNWFQAPGVYPSSNETIIPNSAPAQIFCGELVPPVNVNTSCYSRRSGLEECLFDIKNDPCEMYNLIDNELYQSAKENLLSRLKYWESIQVPPLIPPVDDAANPKNFGYVWTPWTNDPHIPT